MSKSHQFIFVIFAIIIVGSTIWYLDLSHKPVETVDVLIGKNYDYALKSYFKCEPNSSSTVNINNELSEFQGGVVSKKHMVRDSIVRQFTWTFMNHKTTIWVSKTYKIYHEMSMTISCNNRK
jgi:hypothetical protein